MAGVCGLIFLYGLFAYAGLRVAKRAKGAYASLLAAGITSLVLSQACLNLFAILGLAPLTGVPLPFISYGSTNLVVLLAGMGLLLNVARGGSVHLREVSSHHPWAGRARRDRAPSGADGRDLPRSRRAGRRGTSSRRWPSPTRCGLTAPRVVFVGGERAEAELVPAAGYELRPLRVEGLSRTNPLRRRAPSRGRPARCGTARGILARRPPGAVLGGGRVRRRAGRRGRRRGARAARPDRGRQPPRPRQPPAGAASRGASAWPSRSRGAPARATASPAARCRRRRPTAPARARAFGVGEDERLVLVFGGSLGARSINEAAVDGVRRTPPFRVLHASGTRDLAGAARAARRAAARRLRPARRTSCRFGAGARRGRPRRRPLRRLDLRGRRRTAARRSSSPTRTPPPTTRPTTRAGWRTAAPPSWCPTPSSTPRGCGPRSTRCSATRAPGGDGAASAALAGRAAARSRRAARGGRAVRADRRAATRRARDDRDEIAASTQSAVGSAAWRSWRCARPSSTWRGAGGCGPVPRCAAVSDGDPGAAGACTSSGSAARA